jgi:hypothetical protein
MSFSEKEIEVFHPHPTVDFFLKCCFYIFALQYNIAKGNHQPLSLADPHIL